MPYEQQKSGDLVLAPNEQASILDETKGIVTVIVGPNKVSLSQTDRPVRFDANDRRFVRCSMEEAVFLWPFAAEGSYIVLENPASAEVDAHPRSSSNNQSVKLEFGRKINVQGPVTFPLWPGQVAEVVPGHTLRTNQYLIGVVTNDDEARRNWRHSVVRKAGAKQEKTKDTPDEEKLPINSNEQIPDLTMGQRLIIKGAEVSFYIPPTGIAVLKDESDSYVRDAVTLERLEYCILLNEDGGKRFVRGPAVVFPTAEETFLVDEKNHNSRKFRAIELGPIAGLYIKVIADYEDELGIKHMAGDELFITGKEQAIYFPREEHAIIKYGDQEIHHAVAVPNGEARYVMERLVGEINLVRGPAMFLADPRTQVIVRRVLTEDQVKLWFPGNTNALEYNKKLAALSSTSEAESKQKSFVREPDFQKTKGDELIGMTRKLRSELPSERFAGDEVRRGTTFEPPRTITLDTKYDGAVGIDVWPQYAILVTSRSGKRHVVVGPETALLEYDETLMPLELSTGTPKTDERTIQTVYLLTKGNRVSDVVEAETADMCRISIRLSYRVNFEGDDREAWFAVDNYVKLLTDHMRSMLRGEIKKYGVEEFYKKNVPLIRDVVLGIKPDGGDRPGRKFAENNMRIYDVEVLDVRIGNAEIANLLTRAEQTTVQQTLNVNAKERESELTRRIEELVRAIADATAETEIHKQNLQIVAANKELEVEMARSNSDIEIEKRKLAALLEETVTRKAINDEQLEIAKAKAAQELEVTQKKLDLELMKLAAEVEAYAKKFGAVSPDFIAALQTFGDKEVFTKAMESLGVLSVIDRTSIQSVMKTILGNTSLAETNNFLVAMEKGEKK